MRTVLAATANHDQARLTQGLQNLQRRFTRVDGAEAQRVLQFRAGPRAIILQFRATPQGNICFCAKVHGFSNDCLLLRDDIE